jgi:hypothetical protein
MATTERQQLDVPQLGDEHVMDCVLIRDGF